MESAVYSRLIAVTGMSGVNKNPLIVKIEAGLVDFFGMLYGGDEEDRTPDLRIANATLSQLSYVPINGIL